VVRRWLQFCSRRVSGRPGGLQGCQVPVGGLGNHQIARACSLPSNESRLSCGALKKKVSFNILRAPSASSAC